ncbi:MAG: hypothetical protein Q8Q02_12290 [Nocardioides sp.]|nr:hypothetical protein [Nocardioides sp.]
MELMPGEVVGGVIPEETVRAVRKTGFASLGSSDKSVITLDGLLPVAEHLRELHVYGPSDLLLLPAFPRLRNLSIQSSPRKVDFSGLEDLEVLTLKSTPTLRRAMAAADLPRLHSLGLSGASADFAAHDYAIRPTSVSFNSARKLERLDTSLGWLQAVEELEIHGSSRFSLASLRGLPALRRLELHSVTRLWDVAEVGDALADVDVTFESCREVDDVKAFLGLQARTISVVGDNLPVSKAEAARIPVEDLEPRGRWSLPPVLLPNPPVSAFVADGLNEAFVEQYLTGQLSETSVDRLIERVAIALDGVLTRRGIELRPPYTIRAEAEAALFAFAWEGNLDEVADGVERTLVVDHRLDHDLGRWGELRAAFVSALDGPVNDR